MREGGKILGFVLEETQKKVEPGMSTWDIDQIADKLIKNAGVKASFKGYNGFPCSTCTMVNNEVVHAIPRKDKFIKEGDIVTVDCGVYHKGMHTDSAITFPIGEIPDTIKLFLNINKKALYESIKKAKKGRRIGQISNKIERIVYKQGFTVADDLGGHGIGKNIHEKPYIANFGDKNEGAKLKPGMTFAIEPILNMGSEEIETLSDKWTIVTKDGSLSSQMEHTILITEKEPEILTLRPSEKFE